MSWVVYGNTNRPIRGLYTDRPRKPNIIETYDDEPTADRRAKTLVETDQAWIAWVEESNGD